MSQPVIDVKRTVSVLLTDEAWPEDGYAAPGSIYLDKDATYKGHLLFACLGCGRMGSIRVGVSKPEDKPSWGISAGDLRNPTSLTLFPSIHCVGCCGWHGFLTDGVFKSQ